MIEALLHYWDYILSVVRSRKYLVETEDSDDDKLWQYLDKLPLSGQTLSEDGYHYEDDPYNNAEYDDQSPGSTVPAERCDWNNRIRAANDPSAMFLQLQRGHIQGPSPG